jgi:NAD(P)-dependent dehydrogenase (short-subunit alcohol dehydrogenase family)
MAGTVILTGANSSLAIPAVEHLLSSSPQSAPVLTVRNPDDENSQRLKTTIARFPSAEKKIQIHSLDLSDLGAVDTFARNVASQVAEGILPRISAIICNAYHWNLNTSAELTRNGYEKTLQVNFISQAALVLRLLASNSLDTQHGRIVFLGGACHDPGKNNLEKYPPSIPEDLDVVARKLDAKYDADKQGWGFWRYGESKLLTVAFMHALNRELVHKAARYGNITAVAINPGDLFDSRALQTNTPIALKMMQRLVLNPLGPLLKRASPTLRSARDAGPDVMQLALGQVHSGKRGYFTLLREEESSVESMDEAKQQLVWTKTLEWAGIRAEEI